MVFGVRFKEYWVRRETQIKLDLYFAIRSDEIVHNFILDNAQPAFTGTGNVISTIFPSIKTIFNLVIVGISA